MANTITVDLKDIKDIKSDFTGIPSDINEQKAIISNVKTSTMQELLNKVSGDMDAIQSSLNQAHEKAKKIRTFLNEYIQILENSEQSVKNKIKRGLDLSGAIGTPLVSIFANPYGVLKDGLISSLSLLFGFMSDKNNSKLENLMNKASKQIANIINNTQNIISSSGGSSGVSYGSSNSVVSSVVYNSETSSVSDSNIVKNFENISQITKENEVIYKEPSGLTEIVNNPELYTELVNQIKNQFPSMSDQQAKDFIEKLSTSGILTYSSMAGVVINSYENIGGEFSIFNSFVDSNGTFNDKGLIMDIFANVNDSIFLENNNYDFSQNQIDIGNWGENIEANMHEYFESKGLNNLYVESSNVLSSELMSSVTETDKSTMIFNEVNNQLLNNENIIINVKFENGVSFINPSTNEAVLYQDDKIHSLYVTGVTENSITITSFGNKYNINPTDIAKNEHNINIVKVYKESDIGKEYL